MEELDSTKIELLRLTHTAQGVALEVTEKYYEVLEIAHELEDYVDELEEDLADERNDNVEDQQYVKRLKAELESHGNKEALFREALKTLAEGHITNTEQYVEEIFRIGKTY